MKKLFLLLLIAPFVFAYYNKPTLNDHKARIYTAATQAESAADDDLARPEWDNLEFLDWTIVTATRDKQKQSLVSFGIVKWVKVADTDWAPRAFGLKAREEEKK